MITQIKTRKAGLAGTQSQGWSLRASQSASREMQSERLGGSDTHTWKTEKNAKKDGGTEPTYYVKVNL